ncbi:hypothetical protein FA13DRAFT_1863588 [Coprinellus micaceus]|uniref:MARVEL domain-containing protein n=1 Tax=Coprinellus micaceus TaxID=71717 RepID=A0A4Y7T736_COPMI|nr:hypothetical protein FA13DRAFT_1863588 [Coprinellus micaceus]
MANLNELLPLVRTIFFAVVGVFSIIALGLSAHLVHISSNFTPDWAGLGLATSILTLIALPTLFFVGVKRRGAIAAFVAVELVVVVILWVLWLATGADTASSLPGLGFCRVSVCSEMRALEAFAFLNWLLVPRFRRSLQRAQRCLEVAVVISSVGGPAVILSFTKLGGAVRCPLASYNFWLDVIIDGQIVFRPMTT